MTGTRCIPACNSSIQYLPTSYLISVIGNIQLFPAKKTLCVGAYCQEKEKLRSGRLVPLNTLHARLVKARDRHAFTRKVHSCVLRVPERE